MRCNLGNFVNICQFRGKFINFIRKLRMFRFHNTTTKAKIQVEENDKV